MFIFVVYQQKRSELVRHVDEFQEDVRELVLLVDELEEHRSDCAMLLQRHWSAISACQRADKLWLVDVWL